ncbi:MAG: hypothetical protein ACTSPD_14800 [Promethearchaeota archaeon]
MIIGFRKSPGAYLDAQYPPNVASDIGIEPSDLMNIYALHRMRQTKPNYQRIKLKNIYFASFYTGFSIKNCIGFPDKCITLVLDSQYEDLPGGFEGQLRRYALEVLQNINDSFFAEIFMDYYEKLKKGELKSYWKDSEEHDDFKVKTISADILTQEEIENVIDSIAISLDDLDFVDQLRELEDKDDLDEIDRLREYIEEQEAVQRKLAEEILEHSIREEALEVEIRTLEEHFQSQNNRLDDLLETIAELKDEKVILEQENKELKEKLNLIRADHKKESIQMQKKIQELQNISKINLKLTAENETLLKSKEKLKQQILKLKENLNDLKARILEKPVEKIKSQVSVSKTRVKRVREVKPSDLNDEKIRKKWLSMDIKELQNELKNVNMNKIRSICKPWNLKPKGRTKRDLIAAACEYVAEH